MTTDFSTGSVPALYREIFEVCSYNGEPIHRDVYQMLLTHSKLDSQQLKTIWDLAGASQASVSRINLYKTLALIAWAQQGKQLSDKLFENFNGKEYPTPDVGDLTEVRNMKLQLSVKANPAVLALSYGDITQLDSITVEMLPEKKGLFLKYTEYVITSRRFQSRVTRRYNDFFALQELLLNRFPYRMIPRLPPKKIVYDAHFLESRRRGLQRWLTLVCRHPTICYDALVVFFLTDQGSDFQHRIRDIYRRAPDEFMTSDYAASAKSLLPSNYHDIAGDREQIRTLVHVIGRLKYLAESSVERQKNCAKDSDDLADQLKSLGALHLTHSTGHWNHMQQGFTVISKQLLCLASRAQQHANMELLSVCERLSLLLEVLVSHRDLCQRLEKGLARDHQAAISKMLWLKKRRIQGVIRGTDAESVEQLEAKMLDQESIITNMELRADFSLYCVHLETQLVYTYLQTLSSILNSLVTLRIRAHSELTDVWKEILPLVKEYLPVEHGTSNGNANNT